MKGIAHFAVGVAAASCFPEAVRAGASGQPLYFLLGGVFGLLPDTLDFKLYRFFRRHDIEVIPDPKGVDPQMIADAVAYAANRAAETGKAVTLKLDTVQVGADRWRQYQLKFDVPRRRVAVRVGPLVDTSGKPLPGEDGEEGRERFSPLLQGVKLDYEATTTVGAFDGPTFRMMPAGDGRVVPEFIPWHREWSHSILVGLAFALAGGLLWNWLAGAVIFAAYASHALLDQVGFLGGNLFFPLTKRRSAGLRKAHSGDFLPNILTVWISCLAILWNLARAASAPTPFTNPLRLAFFGLLIPLGAAALLRLGQKK
jgi:hypothetical protein